MAAVALKRWAELDYLRGLMALAVLVFHFDKWVTGTWDATTIQGKLGIYAVSTFFVLSGMALTVTYQASLRLELRSLTAYALKRMIRIFPLLWLVTLATIFIDETPRPWPVICLNVTGLFGFFDPSMDIATGAWSIGCELVFYCLFPWWLWLCLRDKRFSLLALLLLAAIGLRAAAQEPFSLETAPQSLWWPSYVQVLFHAYFFAAGIALAIYRDQLAAIRQQFWYVLLLFSGLAIVFMPVGTAALGLLRADMRAVLSGLTILGTAAWCFSDIPFGKWGQKVLSWLGAVSYALYLLHPLVFRATKSLLSGLHWPLETWLLPMAFMGTLLASHLVHQYVERRCMQLGANLSKRLLHRA